MSAGFRESIRVHIVDDGSPSNDVDAWEETLKRYGIDGRWTRLESAQESRSLEVAFELARHSRSHLLYFVEDDYLHYPEALDMMLRSFERLRHLTPDGQVALSPYDCPDRYLRGVYPTTLEFAAGRYWRTTRHTTGTFMVTRQTFAKYASHYHDYCRYGMDPMVNEDTTINCVYRTVPCFSPVPTLAVHLQYEDTIPLLLPDGGWEKLWDSLAT